MFLRSFVFRLSHAEADSCQSVSGGLPFSEQPVFRQWSQSAVQGGLKLSKKSIKLFPGGSNGGGLVTKVTNHLNLLYGLALKVMNSQAVVATVFCT